MKHGKSFLIALLGLLLSASVTAQEVVRKPALPNVAGPTTSTELRSMINGTTGSGALVFGNGPTLVTPHLGTIASGDGAALTGLSAAQISNLSVPDIASLKALPTRPSVVTVAGRATADDGGGGIFYWAAGDTTTADDSMVANPSTGPPGRYKRLFKGTIHAKWFGAQGDNITDDRAAINAAIAYANSVTFPVRLHFDPGYYKITGALTTISKSVRLTGDGTRSAILVFSGDYDCITFKSTTPGVRVADAGIEHLGLYASGMTGGNLIVLDYVQQFRLNDLLIDAPYNMMSIRQAGGTRLSNIQMNGVRGAYSIKGYGAGGLRNDAGAGNQVDRIDIIEIRSSAFQGSSASGTPSSTDHLWFDGYVQTVDIVNVALLTAGRAIRTTNTPGVANPLWPSFITAQNLQVEAPYLEAFRFEYLNTANFTALWVSGSVTENGIYMGPNVREVFLQGRVENNFYNGIQIDGSSDITLSGAWIYRNALVGSGLKSGVYLGPGTVTNFTMLGGLAGKATGTTSYTEKQRFGVDDAAQTGGKIIGTMMNGNTAGKTSGAIATVGVP